MLVHRRTLASIVVTLVALFATAGYAATPKMYLIEVNLKTTLPDGREAVRNPRLMTLEGQEADIDTGERLTPPKGITVKEPLRAGTHCKLKVFRKDGQVFLDAAVEVSSGYFDANAVRVVTNGVHVVEAITLGKKITEDASGGGRWEFVVHEWTPGPRDTEMKADGPKVSDWKALPASESVQSPIATAKRSP